MQKRTSKRWTGRLKVDPREDPLHPESTFGLHPELSEGAADFDSTFEYLVLRAKFVFNQLVERLDISGG